VQITIREIDEQAQTRQLLPFLEERAAEALALVREEALPAGALEAFLERSWDAPEKTLLVAEAARSPPDADSAQAANSTRAAGASPPATSPSPLGLLLSGPFTDPLAGDRRPMILVLWVERSLRHRGLAGALVRRAREIMAERGLAPLAGRAEAGDDTRISMGERWGFMRIWEVMVAE
jgi:ribosomal protein S18 acetylase RimI-like enzyme